MIRQYAVAGSVALAVIVSDLLTKAWAGLRFAGGPVVVIPGVLSFTYAENPGAAFSTFQNAGPVLGVIATLVVLGLAWSLRIERPLLEVVVFGLIIGGALGNLADRVLRGGGLLDGKVVDWIQLLFIPTFNLADASITVAVGLLLLRSWRRT